MPHLIVQLRTSVVGGQLKEKEKFTVHLFKSALREVSDLPFGTAVSLASAKPTYRVDKPLKAPSSIPLLARGLAPSSVWTSTKHLV